MPAKGILKTSGAGPADDGQISEGKRLVRVFENKLLNRPDLPQRKILFRLVKNIRIIVR